MDITDIYSLNILISLFFDDSNKMLGCKRASVILQVRNKK